MCKACKEGLLALAAAGGLSKHEGWQRRSAHEVRTLEAGDLAAITKLVRCCERDAEGRCLEGEKIMRAEGGGGEEWAR